MQHRRWNSSNFCRVALAVLVGIAGFASNTLGQTSYEVVAAFDRYFPFGARPNGALIQGSDGSFYGTTSENGAAGSGTIFKIDSAGTLMTVHAFNGADGASPQAELIQANDGSFYGTTKSGGAAGYGTIFKVDAAGTLTSLHSFNSGDGANPYSGLIQGRDGSLYGTTFWGGAANRGRLFKLDAAGAFTTLHSFTSVEGANPYAGLIQASDGNFYGTTVMGGADNRGTVFKLDAAGTLTTLHSFNGYSEGWSPYGRLIQGSDGSFYGTTIAPGSGTIFKLDAAGTLTTLHFFNGYDDGKSPYGGLIQGSDGSFYGTASASPQTDGSQGSGTIFKIDAAGTLTTLHSFTGVDGERPRSALIKVSDGSFYGTTLQGGVAGAGTIFRIDVSGTLTTLYNFASPAPTRPLAGLMQAGDGTLFGTTFVGGAANRGIVFNINPAGTLTTVHSFASGEGANPQAGLIQASDGSFYGTTSTGGAILPGFGPKGPNIGTIFKIDAARTLTTLFTFDYTNGATPYGRVIQGSDGSFYGTTSSAGAWGTGTVFKIDAAGTLTTVHSFKNDSSDGAAPRAGLIQTSDGSFYGTTFSGGAANRGTVFKLDAAGSVTTLHSFVSSEGANPWGELVQGADGSFYGTTSSGGPANRGTVFKLDAAGGLTTLHSFVSGEGANPQGALIQASDGNFYGTTIAGGAANRGTICRMDPAGTLTTLHSFNVGDGADPYGGVIQGIDGSFYGTTDKGGLNDSGVVFRLTVELPTTTTLTVSPTPSMFGQSITLTATVTIGRATPTGLVTEPVTFFDGSTSLGTATLNGGTATLHTATLAGGSHSLRAEYAGATAFAPSASPMVTHIVALPATFINPTNGATNVDLTQPFSWTSVSGAQAYYLYVGTSVGAKDLVNTGEIQQTSYRVPLTLASGTLLYARLWKRVGGTWRFVDATFSAPAIARFTYPAAGATTVDPALPLTWTAVPAAQAYYLYIGSTLGAKDLVNSGEIQQTSYVIRATLPASQTLYARLWTKAGGIWRFIDRTFSVVPAIARFTYPAPFPPTADPTQPITWTAVPTAQAYRLYVGSSLGAKDLVDTGEIQQTSYLIRNTRPADQILYARLWTKVEGVWRYVDMAFTATSGTALHFTYPPAGVISADMSQPFQWAPVDNAQAYYLYVGTALGRKDLLNTGEIQATSYLAANLPLNQPLYSRLWAKVGSAWSYIDRVITSISPNATVVSFSGLTVNGASVTTYTESGFNVSATSGGWVGITTYGHPTPFIEFAAPGVSTVTGEVRVSAGGSVFSFNSVDLYSSTTPIPYTITGLRNSSTVFTLSGTLPNTFGEFRTVANPNAAAIIDTLSILLTNSAAACCGNPMGLDTIVLTR